MLVVFCVLGCLIAKKSFMEIWNILSSVDKFSFLFVMMEYFTYWFSFLVMVLTEILDIPSCFSTLWTFDQMY
jgi:hypothetical protein